MYAYAKVAPGSLKEERGDIKFCLPSGPSLVFTWWWFPSSSGRRTGWQWQSGEKMGTAAEPDAGQDQMAEPHVILVGDAGGRCDLEANKMKKIIRRMARRDTNTLKMARPCFASCPVKMQLRGGTSLW